MATFISKDLYNENDKFLTVTIRATKNNQGFYFVDTGTYDYDRINELNL